MFRSLQVLVVMMLALLAAGCSVTDPPTNPLDGIRAYSYPPTNGLQYRYARFSSNVSSTNQSPFYDTTTYQIVAGLSQYDTNRIISTKPVNGATPVLYNFVFGTDDQGNAMVDFSNAPAHFIALDGTLADSSKWIADAPTSTTGMIFAHYDEYVPDPANPGLAYEDVIVAKYHRSLDPVDNYTLRFYARGIGLILEKSVVGSATVIGTLELVAFGNPIPN